MITLGTYPTEMSEEEATEYLRIFRSMHPFFQIGTLNIELDGDYVDLSLDTPPTKFQRIRRVTGYLTGTIERWNDAKQAELKDRLKHGV